MKVRVEKEKKNLIIARNDVLNMENLSWGAKGLWAYLMARPDNWNANVSHLSKHFPEGKDYVRARLKELEKFNLCRKMKIRGEDGRYDGLEYVIFELPYSDEEILKMFPETEIRRMDSPETDFPHPVKPHPVNPPLIKTYNKQRKIDKKHICPDGKNASSPKDENAPLSSELDEMGHPKLIEKYRLKGDICKKYESLTDAQKRCVSLLRNVPPISGPEDRFELVTAINVCFNNPPEIIRNAILHYKQRIERGHKIRSTGATLRDIIQKRLCPQTAQAEQNKERWKQLKQEFPPESYIEKWDHIQVKRLDGKDISFNISPEQFEYQVRLRLEEYKETRQE